ncbi:glycosyltransferase family 4 protein [Gemmatimonas sp.]|jgi:glycosyltransferase involved in cell wall biosynthesis|uniref:glycosyltransferase family 4 protein n=1 Tax=Gemmatimonas sp. TaxID=1962908 RepID=UPI0037C0C586
MLDALSILLLSDGGNIAGSTMSVASLARHLRDRGHHVTVGRAAGRLLDDLCNDLGMARPPLDFTSLPRLTSTLQSLLGAHRFDVVNPQASADRRACTLLRWKGRAPMPLVFTRRTMPLTWFPELLMTGYTADRTIAVSQAVRDGLLRRGHPNRGLRIVHNGIMLDRVDRPPSNDALSFAANVMTPLAPRAVVLMVARRKDQGVLLRALPHVSTPVAAVFAGVEPDDELRALTSALPDRHTAVFLGLVPEPLPLYAYAALAVLPSRIEGLSQALLEAMALGVPVMASDAGGNPELIRHGETGWIAPPLDPLAWARLLETALTEPALRQRVGAAARAHVRRDFTLESTAARTEAVYREAIASRLRS